MSGSSKQHVDTRKQKTGHTSHGQGVKKKGKQRSCTRNASSHTSLFGIDCGKFIILGTDGRITEPDGKVEDNNFLKHVMINEFVYLIYAGDNADAKSYIERLRGLLKEGKEKVEGEKVPKLAAKLLKKITNEKHQLKPEGERHERLLNVILACLSSDGLSMYDIDSDGILSTHTKVSATFGGTGGDHAKTYATLEKKVVAHMKEEEAEKLVWEAIAHATLLDWRSGGKIYLLIISKRGRKLILRKAVYGQEKPKYCTSPYALMKGERFIPKCLPAKYFPKDWDLLEGL